MNKNIAVIGAGSAGIQTVLHFLYNSSIDNRITLIYDPDIPILGIGESTNPSFLQTLADSIDFKIGEDLHEIDGTLKFGTKYVNWRNHSFVNPLLGSGIAMHINTFSLKDFAIPKIEKIWKNKFNKIEGKVKEIINNKDKAIVVIDQKEYMFDYIIDCTGFPKSYDSYNVIKNSMVNHALIHNDFNNKNESYGQHNTLHTATKNGWMFTVPLTTRTSYGYLFNDKITKVEEAKKDFSSILDIDEEQLDKIEYNFNSYYAKEIINNRILLNGNKALFFEPMFANSLFSYSVINRILFDYIFNNLSEEDSNRGFNQLSELIYELICFNYHGGSNFDTLFWDNAIKNSSKIIQNSINFKNVQKKMQTINENMEPSFEGIWVYGAKGLNILDQNFEYNYFKKEKI